MVFEVWGFWFSIQGFRGSGFGKGVSGFRGSGLRVLWFSRYGVSGSLLRVFEVPGFGYGVYVMSFRVRCVGHGFSRFGVVELGVSGTSCRVRGFGYAVSRFGVTGFEVRGSRLGFRVLWFWRYGVSSSLLRVFEVRCFGYGFWGMGFRVRGFAVLVLGSLVFEVWGFLFSVKGFRGSGFRVRGLRYEVSGTRFRARVF